MTSTTHKPIARAGGLERRTNRKGWLFVLPAVALIALVCFYPMVEALLLSLQSGKGNNLKWAGFNNYLRMFKDKTFIAALKNTLFYLVAQVPIMLVTALLLASLLNDKTLKCKGLFRTLIFLPCATSLVTASVIFTQIFSTNGFVNTMLLRLGWIAEPLPFYTDGAWARWTIVIVMLWRWTGYNMIFYLAGLQNIDSQIYEAARIDGANAVQQFSHITVPLLRPIILLTTILSTNGTLQLFDEVKVITDSGPGLTATVTLSTYIYRMTFQNVPQFGYSAAMAYVIFIIVAILAFIQMKVGESK